MRLTINGEAVDCTLEQEKTLGEVVGSVRRWLAAEGFLITGLRDGVTELRTLPAESWGQKDIAGVESLEVRAIHVGDMRLEHWRILRSWLGALLEELDRSAIAGANADPLVDLLLDYSRTIEGIAANPFLPAGSDALERFSSLWAGQDATAIRTWTAERAAAARAVTQELAEALDHRIAEAASPGEALAGRRERLAECARKLPDVSVLLQTGRDREAMEIVVGFADTVQSLTDILPFLGPNREVARLFAELTPPLRDLVAAFTNRDSVLIGDILEYEVAPRLERLLPTLESAV